MIRVLALAGLVAADNVPAALGLGALPWCRARRTRIRLALWFVLFEGVMPLIGRAMGVALAGFEPYARLVPVVALGCATLLVLAAAMGRLPVRASRRASWLGLLPLCLSFDNLFAGVALGGSGSVAGEAVVVGAMSGVICLVALTAGQRVTARFPDRSRLVTAGAFMVAAMCLALA